MAYIAPFLLTSEHLDTLPDGVFIVPLCTTRDRFKKITNALWAGGFDDPDRGNYDHLVDLLEAIPRIRPGCEYTPIETCQVIDLNSPLVTWYPESPYEPGEEVPSGYPGHPWTIVTDSILDQIILQFGLGYKPGDVLTDLTKIPIGSSWEDILTTQYLNFPRLRISGLEGGGKVKVHLLSIPQGGRVWAIVDDTIHIIPQDNLFVELDMDLTSFPPETSIAEILEITVEGAGSHHIDLVFIPALDNSFIPLFFGGGVRSIELCGFNLEGGDMTQYCCDETNGLLRVNNQLLEKIMLMLKNGFEIKPIEQLLGDRFPDPCVPYGYDSDIGDVDMEAKRAGALCYTIDEYFKAVFVKALRKLFVPSDLLLTLIPTWDDMPAPFRDLEVDLFPGVTLLGLVASFSGQVQTDIRCLMHTALVGQPNTFEIFANSVKAENNTDFMSRFVYIIIEQANNVQKNWNLFGQVLNIAVAMTDIENYSCPCPDNPCLSADDLILVADTPDTVLEKLTTNTWRVISTYKPGDDPARPNATVAAIKDLYGRCVDFVSFTQTQSDGTTWDCTGEPTYSIGGQGGIAEKVGWRLWDGTTIDTVVTIDCVS